MSISAMKCALQSLESVEKVKGWNKDSIIGRHCTQSAHFLRQAIAEAEKQEPVAWFLQYEYRHEFLWREPTAYEKNSALEVKPLYAAPVHASDISKEPVDETAKDRHEPDEDIYDIWVETPCKTHPDAPHGFDRNASHSADRYVCECEGWEPPKREWVGLDDDIPGLGLVTEEFYNEMLCAEDILRKRNT